MNIKIPLQEPSSLRPAARPLSFLPVPVAINRNVRRAFNRSPVSHRSADFEREFADTRSMLRQLTGAGDVELFLGSGTLANDVVAAQLSLLGTRGLILANGEFGQRLIDHGVRHGLQFETFTAPPGTDFEYAALDEKLSCGVIRWVWAVHCETFTGTLASLDTLAELCRKWNARLCLDCISSVGVVPVRLDPVYLATAVSGKGLGAYPGISMVFYNHQPAPDTRLPRYLDLGHYRAKGGVPFTHSSNLMAALQAALADLSAKPKFERVRKESHWLRQELEQLGIMVVSPAAHSSPAVLTLALPPAVSSVTLGKELEEHGYLLSYASDLLVRENSLRICLMGATGRREHRRLLQCLAALYRRLSRPADEA